MRKFMVLVLIASFLWSGYWFVGKSAKYKVMSLWMEERRAAGWRVAYSDFRVVGFPNRFDSRFRDLDIFDPASGLGWQAPLFNILALSYQPNHIIAAFAHRQTVKTPRESIRIDSREMKASVVFVPDTKLAVRRINLRAFDLSLGSDIGWRAGAARIAISTRQIQKTPFAHEVLIEARKVTPTRQLLGLLDPKGQLPAVIDKVLFDLALGFNAPWDRVAIESGAPEVTSITFKRATINWGKLGLGISGKLDVAKSGMLSGRLSLDITNWRGVLALFQTSGALNEGLARTIKRTLELLTAGGANPANLSIPLDFGNGKMSLGPILLGDAPGFIRN